MFKYASFRLKHPEDIPRLLCEESFVAMIRTVKIDYSQYKSSQFTLIDDLFRRTHNLERIDLLLKADISLEDIEHEVIESDAGLCL